jgi:hypothetical protein
VVLLGRGPSAWCAERPSQLVVKKRSGHRTLNPSPTLPVSARRHHRRSSPRQTAVLPLPPGSLLRRRHPGARTSAVPPSFAPLVPPGIRRGGRGRARGLPWPTCGVLRLVFGSCTLSLVSFNSLYKSVVIKLGAA